MAPSHATVESREPPTPSPPARAVPGAISRLKRFLRAHPVLCLLLLSPGIPEYLSSSSALSALVFAPPLFLFQLGANLGLYGPGVLLIREAMLRYRKDWPSLIAFGCAYAILEEGVALSTLFNPRAGPVGSLGVYGHYLGVNWVWTLGLLMVHTVYSIALPIVLLGLALPETRGRSLLSNRQVRAVMSILGVDVTVLFLVILEGVHFWMGYTLLGGSAAAIGVLVAIGFTLGPASEPAPDSRPRRSGLEFALLGAALFPGTLLIEAIVASLGAPAAVTVALLALFYAGWGLRVLPAVGRRENGHALVALAAGLLAPLMVFGFAAELPVPVVAAGDVAAVLFLVSLNRRYPAPRQVLPAVPAGALVHR